LNLFIGGESDSQKLPLAAYAKGALLLDKKRQLRVCGLFRANDKSVIEILSEKQRPKILDQPVDFFGKHFITYIPIPITPRTPRQPATKPRSLRVGAGWEGSLALAFCWGAISVIQPR